MARLSFPVSVPPGSGSPGVSPLGPDAPCAGPGSLIAPEDLPRAASAARGVLRWHEYCVSRAPADSAVSGPRPASRRPRRRPPRAALGCVQVVAHARLLLDLWPLRPGPRRAARASPAAPEGPGPGSSRPRARSGVPAWHASCESRVPASIGSRPLPRPPRSGVLAPMGGNWGPGLARLLRTPGPGRSGPDRAPPGLAAFLGPVAWRSPVSPQLALETRLAVVEAP